MSNVYLVKDGLVVRNFDSEAAMRLGGFPKATKIVSDEEFNGGGCYARLINGEIVVGRTKEEIAETERQEKIAEFTSQLNDLDKESGAGRAFRKTAMDMAEMLSALRKTAMDFGDIAKLLRATNPDLLKDFNPDENVALQKLVEFDPSKNVDLQKIQKWEQKAEALREQLKPLLADQSA